MNTQTLKYSIPVFMAGVSYGVLATIVKMAYQVGFSWNQVIAAQTVFAFVIFAIVFAVVAVFGKSYQKVSLRQVAKLVAIGMVACTTTVFYNLSLSMLPVSCAITFLFQFVWMGIVIQIVVTRRKPHKAELIAVLIIFIGTLFGSGLFDARLDGVNPLGVIYGLISSFSCACFIFLSGRVETGVPHIQRGMIISAGPLIVGILICPDFFTSGALQAGIWKFGFPQGIFAYVFPIVLLGIGTPHLSSGLATILTSAELPFAVIISAIAINEIVTPLQIFGITAVLVGVVVAQIPQLRNKEKPIKDPP